MAPKIYQEINGSHTFVKKIIMEHYEHISEQDKKNFDKIRVYNTVEDPLFSGPDVYFCLKKTNDNIKRMYRDLLDDEVIKKQRVDSKANITNLITEYGVIHACYLYKNDIAIVFQKFMREIIKQLKNTGVATVVDAHNQLSKVLEEERGKRREAEIINKQNIYLQEAYCNDFSSNESNETELTILRRQYLTTYYVYLVDWQYVNAKYWKAFPVDGKEPIRQPRKKNVESNEVTLFEGIDLNSDSDDSDISTEVKSLKVKRSKKSKLDVTQPHKNGIQEPYEMECINMKDLENDENEEYYFYISAKESTKVHLKFIMPIQLDKAKHYTEMLNYIVDGEKIIDRTAYPINSFESTEIKNNNFDDNVSTPDSKVYKTTYDTLTSARSRSYINMNRELLIGMNTKKRR
jgi:prophage antirepressor-like protein